MPLRADGLSNTSLITSTDTFCARTLEDRFADEANIEDWRGYGGDTSDTGMINAAIADLNAGLANIEIRFPAHNYTLEALLHPITASFCSLTGSGFGTTLTIPETASAYPEIGTFFRLGIPHSGPAPIDDEKRATNVGIRGFRFNCAKTLPTDNDIFAVRADCATQCEVSAIRFSGLAGLIKYGTDYSFSNRIVFDNWHGSANQGLDAFANIYVRHGASGRFSNITATGNKAGGSTDGAIVRIAPPPPVGIPPVAVTNDTFRFSWVCTQFFDATTSTSGKRYGVFIDRTEGNITNLWFTDCVFDHTGETAFHYHAPTGASDLHTRLVSVKGCRFATETGRGIFVDASGGGVLRGMKFTDNVVYINVEDKPAFQILAPGIDVDVTAHGNSFLENDTSVDKANAVILNAKGWNVFGNKVGSGQTIQKWQNAFLIQGEDTDDCYLGPNVVGPGINYVTEQPSPYTAPNSLNRRIDKRNPPPCRLTADSAVITSLTLVDVPGLAVALRPGRTYRVRADLIWQASTNAAGSGAGFAFVTTPATTTVYVSRFSTPIDQAGNAAPFFVHRRSHNSTTTSASVDTATSSMYAIGEALLTTSAAGTVNIRALSGTGIGIRIMAGSVLTVEEV